MRQPIYFLCALVFSILLGISFIYLMINLFQTYFFLGTVVLGFFLFSIVFVLSDQELIQEVE